MNELVLVLVAVLGSSSKHEVRQSTRPPLDKGGLQGGFGAVTENLVWVVDPETHPGASVKASQAFTPSEGGIFKGAM